jgi:hypothetical protein
LRQQASQREEPESGMLIQTILNRIEKQPGFVYGPVRLVTVHRRPALEVALRPRKNRRGRCSG